MRKANHRTAAWLEAGLEETVTLPRLGLVEELGQSLVTTSLIDDVNSQLVKYLQQVEYWMNADMKAR